MNDGDKCPRCGGQDQHSCDCDYHTFLQFRDAYLKQELRLFTRNVKLAGWVVVVGFVSLMYAMLMAFYLHAVILFFLWMPVVYWWDDVREPFID